MTIRQRLRWYRFRLLCGVWAGLLAGCRLVRPRAVDAYARFLESI